MPFSYNYSWRYVYSTWTIGNRNVELRSEIVSKVSRVSSGMNCEFTHNNCCFIVYLNIAIALIANTRINIECESITNSLWMRVIAFSYVARMEEKLISIRVYLKMCPGRQFLQLVH